jgi:hypothetical protein
MKKIVDYIVKNWIILSIMAIGLFLILSGGINSCSGKKAESVVAAVDVSTIRQKLTDSIESVHAAKDIAIIDSMNAVNDKKLAKLRNENKPNKVKLDSAINVYQKDTASHTQSADSAIAYAHIVIDNLEEEARIMSNINKGLNLKIEVQGGELTRAKTSLSLAYSNNEKLQGVIDQKMNWWNRNEKYVYYGAGVATAIVIIKAASTLIR